MEVRWPQVYMLKMLFVKFFFSFTQVPLSYPSKTTINQKVERFSIWAYFASKSFYPLINSTFHGYYKKRICIYDSQPFNNCSGDVLFVEQLLGGRDVKWSTWKKESWGRPENISFPRHGKRKRFFLLLSVSWNECRGTIPSHKHFPFHTQGHRVIKLPGKFATVNRVSDTVFKLRNSGSCLRWFSSTLCTDQW